MPKLTFKKIPKQLIKTRVSNSFPGLADLANLEHRTRHVPVYSKRVIQHLRQRFQLKRATRDSFVPDSLRLDPVIPLRTFIRLANFLRDFAVAFSIRHCVNILDWLPRLRAILSQPPMWHVDAQHYYWELAQDLNASTKPPKWWTGLNVTTTRAEERLAFRPYLSSQSDGVCNVLTNQAARFYHFASCVTAAFQFMPAELHQNFKSHARYRLVHLAKYYPKLTARYRPKIVYLMRYNYFRGRRA